MKYVILSILICTAAFSSVKAQECDIALTPIVTPSAAGDNLAQVDSYLRNRLRMLATKANSISGLTNGQFAIVCGYDIIDKQIVSGEPNKIVYRVNYVMHIVDLKGKKIYASYSKELRGIGDNETKSLINTFQKVNISNAEINTFVQQGKQKIIEYYDNNYQNIIKTAKASAAMKNFDAAIYNLMSVPECCKGYGKVIQELMLVYQQFVNQHCNENLAQARAAWIAAPNSEGAATASVYLSEIYPDAACYGDAQELANEIKKQMGEEWKIMMRRYNDSLSLERQRINAMREISIAYVNSQPKTEVTNVFWK
jgi:hypothetical protein